MTLALGVTAFAQDYDISLGNVTINDDGDYVITGTSSEYNIVVVGANATITLDNVSITTNNGSSAIDIDDSSDVKLIVSGANSLTVTNTDDAAGIHISGGSLTISGSDADDDILTVLNTGSDGATIGSNQGEDFTGTITIDGGVTLNSGYNDIHDNYIRYGAGIGSGGNGEMNGTIIINDESVVNAYSVDYAAGIGSGRFGDMNGTIIINGGDVEAGSGWTGAGIGSGEQSDMNGTIVINGGNITASSLTGRICIGSGSAGIVNGDIIVGSDANITIIENRQIGSYNLSPGTIYLYKGATINGITVSNIDELKEAGILYDNMNVELLEGTEDIVNTGSSYSLGKLSIVSKIKAASAGDKIYVYESQLTKSKLPYYVLEELAKMDDVTLVIVSEDGETVEINSSNIPEKGRYAFFTVEELLAM